MTERTVSFETIALRETTLRKHAERDALILQEDLILAYRAIDNLKSQIEELNKELVRTEEIGTE